MAPPKPAATAAPRSSDPRALRSREALRAALLRLIEHHALDRITLRQITAEAGLSYPTFFNQYDSREALFEDLAREEIGHLLHAFRQDRTLPGWRPGTGMCVYVDQRRALWRVLLTAGASAAMRTAFIRHGHDLASDRATLGHHFPYDLVSGVIASGTFEILAWWLTQDAPVPPATVADMLETLVIEPALDLPRGHFTSR